MKLHSLVLGAALVVWLSLQVAPAAAQYPRYYPPPSRYAPPSYFAGSSYSFDTPRYYSGYLPNYSSYYYAPTPCGPVTRVPRYYDPGPYYYTPASSWSPGYYSYYYTPGYFRY
jgi:hypothetical protein